MPSPNMQVLTRDVSITFAMEEKKDRRRKGGGHWHERIRMRMRMYLSLRAWQALGKPESIALKRVGTQLHIERADDDAGHSLCGGVEHGHRCWLGEGKRLEVAVSPGTYPAVFRRGCLIIDLSAEDADRYAEETRQRVR